MPTKTVAKQQLEKWWTASSQKMGTSDFNSYAPETILRMNQIKVNFQKSRTIISIKKETDPKSPWKQYSRKPTAEDTAIRELCMQNRS